MEAGPGLCLAVGVAEAATEQKAETGGGYCGPWPQAGAWRTTKRRRPWEVAYELS